MQDDKSNDNKCWICFNSINDYILLPHEDEYIGQDISIFKNTFIIKNIAPFTFCYYICCNKCIDDYLKIYHCKFKYIKNRELRS